MKLDNIGKTLIYMGLGLFSIMLSGMPSYGAPTWWKESPKEARAYAGKVNKGLVVYFENEKADACKQMEEETWPNVDKAEADQGYIWLRVNPKTGKAFFDYYQIYQTPQIVVLDAKGNEHGRLKGFVTAPILLDLLRQQAQKVKSGDTQKYVLLPSGKLVTQKDYDKSINVQKGRLDLGAFWSETFDGLGTLDEMDPRRVKVIDRVGTDLQPHDGKDNTQGLVLAGKREGHMRFGGEGQHSTMVWIDLTLDSKMKSLAEVADIPNGFLLVTMDAKAVKFQHDPFEAISLVITGVGEDPNAKNAEWQSKTFGENDYKWDRVPFRSPLLNFKTQKAWLVLKTYSPLATLHVDNIRVEILPPDGVAGGGGGSSGGLNIGDLYGDNRANDHYIIRFLEKGNEKTEDGIVEPFEISPREKQLIESSYPVTMSDLDINKDGKITSEEVRQFKW